MERTSRRGLAALLLSLVPTAAAAEVNAAPVRLLDEVVVERSLTLTTAVRVDTPQDLLLTVSLDSAFLTDAATRPPRTSRAGVAPTAELVVEVSVGGRPGSALPDRVVFHRAGVDGWVPVEALGRSCPRAPPGSPVHLAECRLSPAEASRVERALAGQGFDFVLPWVPAGVHTVTITARLVVSADGSPTVRAVVGRGEITVRSLRLAVGG